MPEFVDLHSHSTASDGTFAPREVVRLAKDAGLVGLALTDHDTINGLAEAADEAESLGITFVSGIEISAVPPVENGTLHILGLCIDPEDRVLLHMARQLIEARDNRNPQIVEALQRLGIDVTMDEWRAAAQGGVLGRPQLAALLVKKGVVKSIKEAFNEYLGQGGKAYFDKERLPPRDAIGRIRTAGGIPVLAHPIQLRASNDGHLDRIVKDLVDLGLEGIEVIHSDHDDSWVEKSSRLAERYGLVKTGGSDFHGANKKDVHLGLANGRRVPREFMDELLERAIGAKGGVKA
jgi:predicted metal-dependent phosphoesterase TrpH